MRPMSPTELDVQREQFHRELMRKADADRRAGDDRPPDQGALRAVAELEADAAAAARRPPAQAHPGLEARLMRLGLPRLELTAAGRARRSAVEEVRALPARPLISVVMPTYETDPRYLQEAIDSVRKPALPGVGAARRRRRVARARRPRAPRARHRLRSRASTPLFCERNGGISAATNAAIGPLPRRVRRLPRPRRRARARGPAARRPGARRRPRARRHLLGLGQAHRPRVPRRPVLQARLVADLRARRDVHRPPARRAPVRGRGGRWLRLVLRHDPGLRVHAPGERADRAHPPHPAHPLSLARDPGEHRRGHRREGQRRRAAVAVP